MGFRTAVYVNEEIKSTKGFIDEVKERSSRTYGGLPSYFRQINVRLSADRIVSRCTVGFIAHGHLLDVCCEVSKDTVTKIKMEVGLPIRIIRKTNQTTFMMFYWQQRSMKR